MKTTSPKSASRRKFIVSTAAAGGGLAIGFNIPFVPTAAAQTVPRTAEINAWVVIRPDNTCVIRVARAEMGQGTHTGLAQLMAEELMCDWNKIILGSVLVIVLVFWPAGLVGLFRRFVKDRT